MYACLIPHLNSGIFCIIELSPWYLNVDSSDCRAAEIIYNDTNVESISWTSKIHFNIENPFLIFAWAHDLSSKFSMISAWYYQYPSPPNKNLSIFDAHFSVKNGFLQTNYRQFLILRIFMFSENDSWNVTKFKNFIEHEIQTGQFNFLTKYFKSFFEIFLRISYWRHVVIRKLKWQNSFWVGFGLLKWYGEVSLAWSWNRIQHVVIV